MERNIAELERRYQALLGDYRSGKIDETAFTAEIDKLQFQDNLGRYWMIGAQTGAWHYYDGQNWRQADPNEADKLPFMDAQGRYWQRGAKSGDWYYYQPETNEWVKPGQNDPTGPAVSQPQPQPQPQPTAYPQQPAQSDTELFQDDEGRYWSLGAKSGQWYFYDHEGWHPASEFEARTGRVQPQPFQQPARPSMPAQGYPGYAQPAYPAQNYPPQQPAPHSAEPQPAYFTPQPGPAPAAQAPGQSGSWFYFDGKQWLQYSTGEPAKDAPPNPALIVDQDTKEPPARAKKAEPKAEPMVAEYIEEDEPPVEVVDVEVITVYEAEPDPQPQPTAVQPEPAPQPKPAPATIPIPVTPRRRPAVEEEPMPAARTATSPLSPDEVVPRREKSSPELPGSGQKPASPQDNQVVPQRRTPAAPSPATTEPSRPGAPRRRSQAAHEPTIIIPTGSTTSTPAAARVAKPSPPPVAPTPAQQQRAREDTMPMEPIKKPEPAAPAAGGGARHHQVTQPLPVIPRTAQPPAGEPPQSQREQRARQKTAENIAPPVAPVKPVEPKQSGDKDKEGYTLGDILRAFPSTLWTGVAGVAVLVIFAFIIIAVFMYGSGAFGAGNVAQVQLPTPTLPAGPPDETPTPGPTPTGNSAAQPVDTPTPATMAKYSSQDLDITLEHPDIWKTTENGGVVIFAPTAAGLDPKALAETKMLIGQPEKIDAPIADILSEVLGQFPAQAETLNEGTISIGSQTWTSTQIRYEDTAENKQGIATIAVTSKDGTGYYLVASSLAQDWNSVQPVFQGMINSFRFGAEKIVAKAETPKATTTSGTPNAGTAAATDDAAKTTPTPKSTPTPAPTVSLTPVVYAIQSGDTLLAVANKFGVDADLLASENGIDNPESLQIGQELTIPFTAEELAAYNSTGNAATGSKTTTATTAQATQPAGTTTASTETQPAAAATATPAPEAAAAPVSGRIVYPAFNNGTGVYDIWMVNLATGEQTPIAGSASQPAFNKDGSLLAYRSWDRGTRGIFFRDFIGGRGDIVTKFVEDGLPAWSPDGLNFVFASRKEGDRVPRIYIGNQMGETPFAVGFQGEYPSVMPDGRLAVKGCTPSGDCGLFMLGPRGGGEKKLSDLPSDTAPAPSPDGGKIAFMSYDRGGAGNWEVWVMNTDGSNMQRLTENASADGLPAWSPDGSSIAFVSNRDGAWAAWVMNADGSNQRKLFDMKGPPDGKVLYDDFNSRGWLEERISWAP